jgi:formiminotetrahydrofolate cyclodeaminase
MKMEMERKRKLANETVEEFLANLASQSPTPGGGSVAALCGALSTALSSMVSRLTIGKCPPQLEKEMIKTMKESDDLRSELVRLVDEDANAFNGVMDAFKMPKENEKQKKERKKKIQEAYKKAALVPLNTAVRCSTAMELARFIAANGNENSISDAGVAALMADAGIKAAIMNVEINLPSIKDDTFVKEIKEKIGKLEKIGASEIMEIIENRLNKK